jgi:putative molybdopterin biosynthesis protein
MLDVMTPEQVAELLQLNTETIYRLIRDKKLAAVKIGRAYRITRSDLEAFLVANSTMPTTLRDALFRRVMAIAERNPGISSDDLLDELERIDEEAKDQVHAHRQ